MSSDVVIVWLISCSFVNTVLCKTYEVGVLLPFSGHRPIGKTAAGAIPLAFEEINSDPRLTFVRRGGHDFSFIWKDTKCKDEPGLAYLVEMWARKEGPVDAYIGTMLAQHWSIPVISGACSSVELSDKQEFPNIVRTIPPNTKISEFVVDICRHYSWERITLVVSAEREAILTAAAIERDLVEANVQVYIMEFFDVSFAEDEKGLWEKERSHLMDRFSAISKVFLILENPDEATEFLLEAYHHGMMNGENAFITVDFLVTHGSSMPGPSHGGGLGDEEEPSFEFFLNNVYQGILDIVLLSPHDSEAMRFWQEVRNRTRAPPFNSPIALETEVDPHAFSLYDAVLLYGLAVNASLADGRSPENSSYVMKYLMNREIKGIRHDQYINHHGDGLPMYELKNFYNGKWYRVMEFITDRDGEVTINKDFDWQIVWPGNSSKVVLGRPDCGWNGEYCEKDWTGVIVSVTVLFVVIVVLSVAIAYYRYRKKELEMLGMSWKVELKEIDFITTTRTKSFASRTSRSTVNMSRRTSLTSGRTTESQRQLFTTVAQLRGNLVAVKPIQKSYVLMTRELVYEVNQVKMLHHANINTIIGACVEPNNLYVLSPYCSKGSLSDVLENDNIKMDNIFKLSFASDIAQGMLYIHESPLQHHGRLKSSNVLVDGRWTCKLSDIGLNLFRQGETLPEESDPAFYYRLLWTAPEHLRSTDPYEGSQKGDVYSFAIILQEIILRSGPFGNSTKEPKEIIRNVKSANRSPPFRPKLRGKLDTEEAEAMESSLGNLTRSCWEEMASLRPSFSNIKDALQSMNKGKNVNLVDQMMNMMEKYADHLEELVEDRTQQLAEEQRKTEELLSRMLPPTVANELKLGNTVSPETYPSSTVFFSDIVGFTKIAQESSPMEIVDFLNELYTCFDTIIEGCDVYKVETIGDAYMVVSGVPSRNGIRHVAEIATLSLELLSSLTTFRIKHLPDKQLQARIGMHSGPVAAGVVGLKMPRYCLFGDTVNYASRMESSGLGQDLCTAIGQQWCQVVEEQKKIIGTHTALRIHVSPESKDLLDKIGSYHLRERGQVTMKGKGTIRTYFLTGKDGFDKPLPDLSKALPESEHEFK